MKKIKELIRKYLPSWVLTSAVLLVVSAVLLLISVFSAPFADFINDTLSSLLRALGSILSYAVPFSIFEITLILLIPSAVLFIVWCVRRHTTALGRIRAAFSILGVISLLLSSYVLTLGIGYRTTPIEKRMGLEAESEPTAEDLMAAALILRDEVNLLSGQIEYEDGVSKSPFNSWELGSRLTDDYAALSEKLTFLYNFPSRGKGVIFSYFMSDAGITGIYSYFTGEANINTEYPDYSIPYTTAHELAHQRGICREDEANFVAFLVTYTSEDPYVRYSGCLNMLEYIASALYRADDELYAELMAGLDEGAKGDIRASREVSARHKDSLLYKITDKANDTYLKANGTEGVVSYGLAVRLAVAYLKN